MTNILLTGSSRGIGAAIASALTLPDVTLVGHGTASGIPADFADPAGPAERSGTLRSSSSTGRLTC